MREADALADALGALAFAGLLGKRELSGEPVWEFALARTREQLAASLPDDKRRLLHDAAAAYFEERLAERPDLLPAAALHALRGSDAERAVRLGLASAARAERLFAYDQAAQSYSGVLEFLDLAGRAAEKGAVRERLGDVHFRAGNWRRALAAYHFLLKELGVRPDADDPAVRRHAALLTFKIGMIRLRRGDVEAARALFDRAEGELGTVGTTEERARLLDASARARLERGDPDGAEAKAEAALALAGPELPDDLRSLLLGTLGSVAFQRGDHAAAEERLEAAVEAARRTERGDLVRRSLSALAAVLARTGRWQESEAMERECLEEAERSRDLWGITASLANLATLQCGRGDYAAARSGLERAFEIHRRLGSPFGQAQTAVGLGRLRRGPRALGRGGGELSPRPRPPRRRHRARRHRRPPGAREPPSQAGRPRPGGALPLRDARRGPRHGRGAARRVGPPPARAPRARPRAARRGAAAPGPGPRDPLRGGRRRRPRPGPRRLRRAGLPDGRDRAVRAGDGRGGAPRASARRPPHPRPRPGPRSAPLAPRAADGRGRPPLRGRRSRPLRHRRRLRPRPLLLRVGREDAREGARGRPARHGGTPLRADRRPPGAGEDAGRPRADRDEGRGRGGRGRPARPRRHRPLRGLAHRQLHARPLGRPGRHRRPRAQAAQRRARDDPPRRSRHRAASPCASRGT